MNSADKEDIVVFITRREGKCADCGREISKGDWIRLEKEQPLCLDCADLEHLEYLPRGDAALTRRATKYSPLRAVVVQWSRSRQVYERQGILADPIVETIASPDRLPYAGGIESVRVQVHV